MWERNYKNFEFWAVQQDNGGRIKGPDMLSPLGIIPRYPKTPEEWASFKVEWAKYDDGEVSGDRLLIGGWSVMEEWEKPAMERNVQLAFSFIQTRNPIIFRAGEGPGYATDETIDQLRSRGGGRLHIAELHPEILEKARLRVTSKLAKMAPAERARIQVVWHLGDAREVKKTFQDNYFDWVDSDTFPLKKSESRVNDYTDIDESIRILKETGVFTGFVGYSDGPSAKQLSYISGKFDNNIIRYVDVHPGKDCPYFQGRRMAIMACVTPHKPFFFNS